MLLKFILCQVCTVFISSDGIEIKIFTSELFRLTGLEYQMVFIAESHLLFWRSLLNFWIVVYTYLNFLSLIGNNQSISLKKWSFSFNVMLKNAAVGCTFPCHPDSNIRIAGENAEHWLRWACLRFCSIITNFLLRRI